MPQGVQRCLLWLLVAHTRRGRGGRWPCLIRWVALSLQRAHLVLDLVDFGQGTLPDIGTLCLWCCLQCQEFMNLLQGELEKISGVPPKIIYYEVHAWSAGVALELALWSESMQWRWL